MKRVEATVDLALSPKDVLDIFIKEEHLRAWWGVDRSLIDLRQGGTYSLVWQSKENCFDYATTGVISDYLPACQLHIENMIYINPIRKILGPMELFVMVTPEDNFTQLTVIQTGYQSGPDWDWYYEAVKKAWPAALHQAKHYLDSTHVV